LPTTKLRKKSYKSRLKQNRIPTMNHLHDELISIIRRGGAVLILASLVLLPACSRKTGADREVWAEVDGQPVLREQVEKIYRGRTTTGAEAVNPEQEFSFKLSILNELINNQILIAHASHAHISVSEPEIDTKVAELQSPYTKEEFQKKLADQAMTLSELRQEVRQSLMISKLINKEISARLSVTDAEIASFYEHNKASFNVQETVFHLAQIVVTSAPDPEIRNLKNDDAKTPAAAQRKIQALYAQLASGESFAKVAQEYSEDPVTASGGGDRGFVRLSELAPPQIKQLVNSMKVGQMSGILSGERGFLILKLLGREEAGQRQLDDLQVQASIRQNLMNEKEQLLKAAYIEVLRNRAKIENYLATRVVDDGGVKTAARK
jgi:peptidyl-prolyl cis-trans isomerase SurA